MKIGDKAYLINRTHTDFNVDRVTIAKFVVISGQRLIELNETHTRQRLDEVFTKEQVQKSFKEWLSK